LFPKDASTMDFRSARPEKKRRIGLAIAGFFCGMATAALLSAMPSLPSRAAETSVSRAF